mmetsp:Transcript_14274/g.34331  ORF Transcript_14274/g.34331 Transcript_14274/m.34331 type:complete len:378 (-) Transcript_14274:438-1571(-)
MFAAFSSVGVGVASAANARPFVSSSGRSAAAAAPRALAGARALSAKSSGAVKLAARTTTTRRVVAQPFGRRGELTTTAVSTNAPPSSAGPDAVAEDDMHDNAPIPRLERALNSSIIAVSLVIIDKIYEGRDYQRFYALETVARVPYFSFLSVLHLYETLGFWRRADYLKVHFAQTMNEFHHLLIMESLGGDKRWSDRFVAQHMAMGYYGLCCLQYLVSPRMAYNMSEQVESHAYHTYDVFLTTNEAKLKKLPPPAVAVRYYTEGDLFLFDEFQTGAPMSKSDSAPRRPKIDTLYDVFVNVRNDEAEHMKTMQFCQLPGSILRAPSEVAACASLYSVGDGEVNCMIPEDEVSAADRTCEGLLDCVVASWDEKGDVGAK